MVSGGRNRQVAYVSIGVGALLVYSALVNRSVLGVLQDLVSGKQPAQGPKGSLLGPDVISGTGTPDPSINTGSRSGDIRGAAQGILNDKGRGSEFGSADKLLTGESGWSPTAENPSTNAFGVGQALNHGGSNTASPTLRYQKGRRKGQPVNMYGAQYGLSVAEAVAANSGDGVSQFLWADGYVRSRYFSWDQAYRAWLSRNPHWY